MAKDRVDAQIRDTNTYTYDARHVVTDDRSVFQIRNNLDANVDITVYGTYDGDDNWNDKVTVISTVTVSSGGGNTTKTLQDPWDKLRFEVVAASSPSSGNLLIKEHQ